MAEQDPAVEPITSAEGESAIAKIRARMSNQAASGDVAPAVQEQVDPGLCINCQNAELENGECPSCGFDNNKRLYSGGI